MGSYEGPFSQNQSFYFTIRINHPSWPSPNNVAGRDTTLPCSRP